MFNLTFSQQGYRSFLERMLDRQYQFCSFDRESLSESELRCMLRHDVDADPHAAHKLAAIESEYGIKSTYFIMLRSPVYNLFARENSRLIERIVSNGHDLGLHYDEGFISRYGIQQSVEKEASFLEEMFGVKIQAVSFHQPSRKVIDGEIGLEYFINTYDRQLFKNFSYFSDSNMVWRSEEFDDCVSQKKSVQVNFHPLWWFFDEAEYGTEALWDAAFMRNIERAQDQLVATERAFGTRRRIALTRE